MIVIAKFFLWLLSLLPAGAPYRLGMLGAGLWMRFSPVKRHTTERNLERCDELVSECFASNDYKEGRKAFMEKRKPQFTGS